MKLCWESRDSSLGKVLCEVRVIESANILEKTEKKCNVQLE